jgi:MFS family permease
VTPLLHQATRLGRDHYAILLLCWAGWLFDFYDLLLYSFLLVPVAQDLHFSRADSSLLLGVSLGVTACGGIVFGRLSDSFGRKTVLGWTIVTYSAGTLLSGCATGFYSLLLARAVTALGVGGEWATGQTLVSETFPAERRGHYAAVIQTGAPLGMGLAAVMGSFFAPAFGWRAAFIVSALPAVLVTVIRTSMPESDLWRAEKQAGSRRTVGFAALVRPEVRGLAARAFLVAALNMSAYWFTYSWLPAYLVTEHHVGVARSGIWILTLVGGQLLGYGVFGALADRFGRRPTFTAFTCVMAVGLLMITIFWSVIERQPLSILFCMAVVGLGTGSWSTFGPMFSELFPTAIRGTAVGTVFNLARGAQFLTPIVITKVAEHADLATGISLSAGFSVAAGVAIWLLPETRGRQLSGQ